MSVRWLAPFVLTLVVAASCSDDGSSDAQRRDGVGGDSTSTGGSGGTAGSANGGTGVGGGHHTGGGPRCAPGEADGIALAVADLVEGELDLEGLAFFDYAELYSGAWAMRDGGWLVGAYQGFWDVGNDGSRPFVAEEEAMAYRFLTGDLDGDGTEDVISMHWQSDGGVVGSIVVVWQRRPDGSLERRFDFGHSYSENEWMALGDIDGDADLDILNVRSRAPMAYRHDGNFGFEEVEVGAALPIEYANGEPLYVGYYDADADGSDDIVAVRYRNDGTGETFVATFPGTGAGQFSDALISDLGEFHPYEIEGGHDLTGDGVFDLLILDDGSDGSDGSTVTVARGSADGRFELLEPRIVESGGYFLVDVNDDGIADLLSSSPGALRVDVTRVDGTYSTRTYPVALGRSGAIATFRAAPGDPLRVGLTVGIACGPPCDETCTGSCFLGRCFECTASDQCNGGRCIEGTCETCGPSCGGAGSAGAAGAAGAEGI